MKTLLCNSRPWSSTETHPPTTEPMLEKLGKDSNPNPNLELLSMAEIGKPKSTKKLPSKLEWETPSPPRRHPPKSQQHQYTDPLRGSRVERTNPTLPNTHLVGMGMYTAWQNQGPPQPPELTRPPEVSGNRRNRRRKLGRSRFTLFY